MKLRIKKKQLLIDDYDTCRYLTTPLELFYVIRNTGIISEINY